MRGRTDALLLYLTLVLAAVTAVLSSDPVRRAVADYVDAPPAGVTMVIGQTVPDDPAKPDTALEWKTPLGD
jgi:hypothetical protein